MVSREQLREVEENARVRFSERLDAEGHGPQALGWDDEASMRRRFRAAGKLYDFADARVLDVGCGFGDLLGFLRERDRAPAEYVGVDINAELLEFARERYPDATFEERNPLVDPYESATFDVAVGFGIFNHDYEPVSNEAYLGHSLERLTECADTVLVNALSEYRNGSGEYKDTNYCYSPEWAFRRARTVGDRVTLQHGFSTSRREFNLLVESC